MLCVYFCYTYHHYHIIIIILIKKRVLFLKKMFYKLCVEKKTERK